MKRTLNTVSVVTIVLGILVSSGIGLFFYFKTDVSTALATFAGLLGTIITLQLDSSFRQTRNEAAAAGRDKMVAQLERVPWQLDAFARMLSALEFVDQMSSAVASGFARKSVERCLLDLDSLKRGRYETDASNDFNLLAYSLDACRQSMVGVSLDELDTEWLTTLGGGRAYWSLQLGAIRRGVDIDRVFVYSDWTEALDKVAREQADAGVKIWRVHRSKLPETLHIDIAIWDSSWACQTALDSAGKPTLGIYTMDSAEVGRKLEQYKIVRSSAEPFPMSIG